MITRPASDGQNEVDADATVDLDLAARLFEELKQRTGSDFGLTRPSYGLGEQIAHDMVRREARRLGLAVSSDAGCNLYATLKGRSAGPGIFIGSHLDTVPRGGNFDGAAGVLMGLAVVSGYLRAGIVPGRDITVMAIRSEESAWFGASYIGSRAAFARLRAEELDSLHRTSDRVALSSAIDGAGGDTPRLRAGEAYLSREKVGLFIEPHIEQGPVLVGRGIPVGIVTGIRGSFRFRDASCKGRYAHSGATPLENRADAVRAVATLVVRLDEAWMELRDQGADLVVTFSEFYTDANEAAFSKIAGKVDFSLDVRSEEPETLRRMRTILGQEVERIEREHNVRFNLGGMTASEPARMAPEIVRQLERCAEENDIPALTMPCGAGHDAAVFASEGIPTGMIFIRNENGSHNPAEYMAMDDFAAAARLLSSFCLSYRI